MLTRLLDQLRISHATELSTQIWRSRTRIAFSRSAIIRPKASRSRRKKTSADMAISKFRTTKVNSQKGKVEATDMGEEIQEVNITVTDPLSL